MKTKKRMSTNFSLVVVGQIISLFGNGILRFALPLYILQETGSAAVFGMVSALSFVPLVVVMPIGGIVADYAKKRDMMVLLDFLTGLLMTVFLLLLGRVAQIPLLVVTLMLLYSISGLYQPIVQASMPVLLEGEMLVRGNAIISSVSALSNLLSPVIGGFLFGLYGIVPIVVVSVLCFVASAVLELFIKIPYHKHTEKQGIFSIVRSDLRVSLRFVFLEKKVLSKMIATTCVINACVSALILIALPILITERLGLSTELYGIATGMMAFGSLFGGVLAGICKPQIQTIHRWFWGLAVSLVPFAAAPLFASGISFALILVSVFAVMSTATISSILLMTFVQNNTPEQSVGKVMALLMTLSICAQPIGQAFYGIAFSYGVGYEPWILSVGVLAAMCMAVYIKHVFAAEGKVQ